MTRLSLAIATGVWLLFTGSITTRADSAHMSATDDQRDGTLVRMDTMVGSRSPESRPVAKLGDIAKRRAVTVNVLGPIASGVLTGLDVPTVSLSVRYHQRLDQRFAVTVAPNLGFVSLFGIHHYAVGAKVGVRYSWREQGLEGWFVSPTAMASVGWARASGQNIAASVMLGAGFEIGKAWHWGSFVLETSAGWAYLENLGNVAQVSRGTMLANLGVGYAW